MDIHVLDVAADGALLSGGDAACARAKLDRAATYSVSQRAHHNALETLPMFLALSMLGGQCMPCMHAWTTGVDGAHVSSQAACATR